MTQNIKVANPTFTFYLENKKAGKYKVFASDLRHVFGKWMAKKEKVWLEYYDSETIVRYFLTDKEGMNSTFEEKEFPELYRILKIEYKKFVYEHK